jgi:hypothetical protein
MIAGLNQPDTRPAYLSIKCRRRAGRIVPDELSKASVITHRPHPVSAQTIHSISTGGSLSSKSNSWLLNVT